MDRFFDNYVSTPQQCCVLDALRPADARDPRGVADAKAMLETAYAWLDGRMAGRTWAAGEHFSLADCGAAPFLFYAHWTHPIPDTHGHLLAYRRRLLARPSYARARRGAPVPAHVPARDDRGRVRRHPRLQHFRSRR